MARIFLKDFDVVKNEHLFSGELTNLQGMKEEISNQYSISHSARSVKMVDDAICGDNNFDNQIKNVKRLLFLVWSHSRVAGNLALNEKLSTRLDQKLGSL